MGYNFLSLRGRDYGRKGHYRDEFNDPASTHPKHPNPYMPKFDKMTDKMLLDLATYLESLK